MFDVGAAYNIAERMVRSAIAKDIIHYGLNDDDYSDFVQEAVAEMWQAHRRTGRTDRPYLAGAARAAIRRYALRLRFGRNSVRPGRLVPLEAYHDDRLATQLQEDEHDIDAMLAVVWEYLFTNRRKHGHRGEQAADRDVAILLLLMRGYTNEAIAVELGMPVGTVKVCRQRIRARLRVWVKEKI